MASLNRQTLLQLAAQNIGTSDFHGTDFYPALDALLSALAHDTKLTPQGVQRNVVRLILDLKRRAILARFHKNHPQISSVRILQPTFIVGFPRTGTTLLHRLLAAHSQHRAIRLWELRVLVEPRNASPTWQQSVIDETRGIVELMASAHPALADMHPVDALAPDECNWLTRNSFATMFHSLSFHIPSYVDWLLDHPMQREYAYHRLQLQAMLSQRPGEHLILKDPCHSWHLDALVREYPDAKLIVMNRDIVETALSFCRLCRALWTLNGVEEPAEKIGPYVLNLMTTAARRIQGFCESAPPEQLIELTMRELVESPLAALEHVCEQLGRPLDGPGKKAAVQVLSETRPRQTKAKDSLEVYGITEQQVKSALQS